MEYDIIVKPGADPSKVRFAYNGIEDLVITENGDLEISLHSSSSTLTQKSPIIYQEIDGKRIVVEGRFNILGNHYTFDLASYDKAHPLVIDPVLVYATYLGGGGNDYGHGITVDRAGNVYVTGVTASTDFPATLGAYDTTGNGVGDVFVAKLDVSGTALVYSTYLGGSSADSGNGIAVDGFGNAYVTGDTGSTDFPATPGAYDTTFNGGSYSDVFVAKLDLSGTALVYSTYIGGSSDDYGRGITVDGFGNAYVTGWTPSPNFPATPRAFDTTYNGDDGFVVKLSFPPAELPRTGQTTCYDTYGAVISCAGTGQDGEIQSGVPWPNPRFTDNTDSTVTDNLTGMMWTKDANLPGTWLTWQQGLDYLAAMNTGTNPNYGYNDWRLPNVNELSSLIDWQYGYKALTSGHPFVGVLDAYYWSSTSSSRYPQNGMSIFLADGGINPVYKLQTGNFAYGRVWPVRGGQVGTVSPCVPNTYYQDADNDTYGNASVTTQACTQPSGYVSNSADCNDSSASINPGATEVCNGVDDNCSGQIDEGVQNTYYRDADSDTYGNASVTTQACTQPSGYVSNNTDCNDGNASIHPGATEVCNGVDDNCNDQIDEGVQNTYYRDADNDTYGNASVTTHTCTLPSGYVSNSSDCNDSNAAINPGAAEVCNGVDDNCNTLIDENVLNTYYHDVDNDAYGNPLDSTQACTVPTDYVADNTDCNDSNASINPAATEVCNGVDDNCSGQIDEGVLNTYYRDADNDTYGNPSVTTQACTLPSGYVSNSTDCNDSDAKYIWCARR